MYHSSKVEFFCLFFWEHWRYQKYISKLTDLYHHHLIIQISKFKWNSKKTYINFKDYINKNFGPVVYRRLYSNSIVVAQYYHHLIHAGMHCRSSAHGSAAQADFVLISAKMTTLLKVMRIVQYPEWLSLFRRNKCYIECL